MLLYRDATCLIVAPSNEVSPHPQLKTDLKTNQLSEYFVTVNDKISRCDENQPWCCNSLNKSQRPVIKVWCHPNTAIALSLPGSNYRIQQLAVHSYIYIHFTVSSCVTILSHVTVTKTWVWMGNWIY
jgi:hypothetical protein